MTKNEMQIRNANLAIDVLRGMLLREAGQKYGLSHERARQLVRRVCRRALPAAYEDQSIWWHGLSELRLNKESYIGAIKGKYLTVEADNAED